MKVLIKILKIILGIVIGLVWSLCTIVCLEMMFRGSDIYQNLWISGVIIASWLFISLWFVLRVKTTKKIHTQGIEDLPISISEFIDEIIIAMKYRRSVRAEVRQELTDHFTDALADCDTEEEKQTVTKELIAEFGDIELLGKLLRRAKKRCRPLWQKSLTVLKHATWISFVLLLLYIGWFFTGKPQITTNYLEVMNQKVRPVADDNQNAWPFYKQAAEKYVQYEQPEEKDQQVDFSLRQVSEVPDQDLQIIQQSINDNKESLELIRQGNRKPYYWQTYGTNESSNQQLISVNIPYLNEYRKLTNLMCWRGLLSAKAGDFEKGLDDILECYSFGDHLRGQGSTFIEQLVAMAVESVSRETLLIALSEYGEQIDIQVLDSMRKRFSEMIDNKDFTIDYGFEKMFMYDEAQRCFTQSRFGKSHLYLKRISQIQPMFNTFDEKEIIAQWFNIIFTHPDKEQTLKEVERLYSQAEKKAALTPATVRSQGLDMDEFTEEATRKNVFLNVLLPAISRVNQIAYRVRAQAEATLVIVSLLQHKKQYGEYPELLDVLVEKGLLKVVPTDPFSDKPLVYRETDDGFTLYSVGYNFTDDGGIPGEYKGTNKNSSAQRWTDTGDAVFWPVDVQ